MSTQKGVNTFKIHYENNIDNIIAESFAAIQEAVEDSDNDLVSLEDFKRKRDLIFNERRNSTVWRSLSDLYAAGVIDKETQEGTSYITPLTDSIDESMLEDIPSAEEYKESLVSHDTHSVKLEEDWISYDVKGETVSLPRFPVEFFKEHFSRNGYENEIFFEPSEDNPVAKMLVVQDESTWGDIEKRAYVFNQSEEEHDFIKLAADVNRPEFLDEPFYSESNTENWLSTIKNQEIEPLIGDVEEIYQKAYAAATGEHEAFTEEVENLRDVRDALNERPQRSTELSIADVIERSRESNEYFGNSSADRSRVPLVEYLNFGRGGKVAPVSAQYSSSQRESEKVDRGNLMEDMYFEALERFAEEFYDDFNMK